jgi:hypothetical protein
VNWGKPVKTLVFEARGLGSAATLVLALSAFAVQPACAQDEADSEQIRDQTGQVLDGGDIQSDAPLEQRVRQQTEQLAQDPTLQHEPPKPQPEIPEPQFSLPIPADLFLYLLLATLAICLGLVGYHLYRTYAPGGRALSKRGDQPLEVATRAIGGTVESALPEPDEIERLARAGAYAEAIHLMLLRALHALRRRLGASWSKSMTSREIVRRPELGPGDRQALRMLVGAVEISRFGEQGANEQIYRTCLDHYRLIGGERRNAEA